jgi:NADPH2:quinone reductase
VLQETGGRGVDVVFDNVGEAVMDGSFRCIAYNGRYLMMGFASNKVVADEPFIVPRRLSMGNFKLCGVLLSYQSEDMIGLVKQGMGWNVAPRALGEMAMDDIVELVHTGAVHAVVGSTPDFVDLPAAMAAMADRNTIGRVIVMV